MLRGLGWIASVFAFIGLGATTAPLDLTPRTDTCIPADQCCKICSKGKACGNSCIRQSYQCHKERGCACDADEVCN